MMNALLNYGELAREIGVRAAEKHPLASHTTMRIGGPADWAFFPRTPEEAAQLYAELLTGELPVRIIGGGSNLLIPDAGLRAAVILTGEMNTRPERRTEGELLVLAGTPVPGLTRWAAKEGLAGLEFAEGIPAQLGGAIRMNAGANQSCFGEITASVLLAAPNGRVIERRCIAKDFSYRTSFVTRESAFVLAALLELEQDDAREIKRRCNAFRNRRRQSQPLTERSAGCVFANWPEQSAGALIDRLGLKGLAVGDAMISHRHANFIINRGAASAADVLTLVERVSEALERETGRTPRLELQIWEETL